MDSHPPHAPNPLPELSMRDRAGGIVATGTVLALLYLGRDVLVPVTLAVILSLLIAPLVRALRLTGIGQTGSVLVAVMALVIGVGAMAGAIGMQVARMAATFPQYEANLREKLDTASATTLSRVNAVLGQSAMPSAGPRRAGAASAASGTPLPVQVLGPPPPALEVLRKVLGSLWVPIETAGIVLVVLTFTLLEHEALRDRFIRIAGGTDIRATTLALNDAGERLSRFFVSQFMVNVAVAIAVWLGLWAVGLPHALLWGALTGVLRFVPYVGVWIAAFIAALLGAAVAPGWSLAVATLGWFVIVELTAGQLIEPQLYGHTTGLSPLSVVISAIFWSWLWGPTGLIVSTPLTLCLVVAGRHIKALSLLDVLLGDTQALTMPQRVYQRALSGDADEIIASARKFLKRNSFAAYCDAVLMPALSLARLDLATGAITIEQQMSVRDVIVNVVGTIGGTRRRFGRTPRTRTSVLDQSSAGLLLRKQRERVMGPFQGPLAVPEGTVMVCCGLGSLFDEFAAELLVRILREQKFDARHVSLSELTRPLPAEADAASIWVVFMVSASPGAERAGAEAVADDIRARYPAARLATVFLPGMLLQPGLAIDTVPAADKAATSFGQAVLVSLQLQEEKQMLHKDDSKGRTASALS